MTATGAVEWVDVEVSEIRRTQSDDPAQREHIMILAERGGERSLPIWIGPSEATALALTLASAEMPRPFTYKLATSLVAAAGSGITEVRITKLIAPVFYASVIVAGPSGPREVDARPSDAVNLALVAGAPVRIDSELFSHEPPAGHVEGVLSVRLWPASQTGSDFRPVSACPWRHRLLPDVEGTCHEAEANQGRRHGSRSADRVRRRPGNGTGPRRGPRDPGTVRAERPGDMRGQPVPGHHDAQRL